MDKLKEILALNKPKQKITIQKEKIQQQNREFLKNQQEAKRLREQQQSRKLTQIADFYGKPRKIVKLQNAQPPISVEQVKQELRKLHQPATFFGQTTHRRYERLLKAKKFHEAHPLEDMKLYDQQFVRKIKENEQYEQLDGKYRQLLIEPKILNDAAMRKKKQQMIQKQEKKTFAQMCDQIHLWIIKVLKDWAQSIQQKKNNEMIKDKTKLQLLRQTTEQMQSFYEVLKQRNGDHQMIESIYYIMNCCLIRQYVQANGRYIDLSIGKAPWPMGVAMLGITVRRNTERLSFVLDNEITRKWILGIKRFITISQQLYPSEDRMKMVGYTVLKLT